MGLREVLVFAEEYDRGHPEVLGSVTLKVVTEDLGLPDICQYLVSASDPHPLVPARRSLLGGQRDVEPGKRYLPPPSAAAPG